MNRRSLRLRTRFMLVAAAAVVFGLVFNLIWAIRGLAGLETASTEAIGKDLREVNREYLETYLAETSCWPRCRSRPSRTTPR